jgi:hypothetical protein
VRAQPKLTGNKRIKQDALKSAEDDEDLGFTIKRKVRRIMKPGDDESDYDVFADEKKEEEVK